MAIHTFGKTDFWSCRRNFLYSRFLKQKKLKVNKWRKKSLDLLHFPQHTSSVTVLLIFCEKCKFPYQVWLSWSLLSGVPLSGGLRAVMAWIICRIFLRLRGFNTSHEILAVPLSLLSVLLVFFLTYFTAMKTVSVYFVKCKFWLLVVTFHGKCFI